MIIFLDTEFTELVMHPRLLSAGMVVGGGNTHEFYAEVSDLDRIQAASWFAMGAVLPQFGHVKNATCPYAVLGTRLVAFLDDLLATVPRAEPVELAFGHHLDWELIDQAAIDSGAPQWDATKRRIKPVNVYEATGFDAGRLASEAYFKTQADAAYGRHHALCDARALRIAYDAAIQTTAAPQRVTAPALRHVHQRTDQLRAASYGRMRAGRPWPAALPRERSTPKPNPDMWAQLHMRLMALARWDGEGGAGPQRPTQASIAAVHPAAPVLATPARASAQPHAPSKRTPSA